MNKWILFGLSGNPSYEVTKAYLTNHDIPFEKRSIFSIKREEIEKLIQLTDGGIKDLIYPDTFSFTLVNPLRWMEKDQLVQLHDAQCTVEEAIDILVTHPFLMLTPILTDFNKVIVGYDSEAFKMVFRNVVVKNVTMA